ncbi:hypothetical protein A5633_25645 [Mycolicibacterium elephantis]|uniref:hypothetical protein n=1 Tax=Mycolicibacterium elephantis TaxID=81858 RepID=UPI0007EAD9CF|nr:hypothetical protein [Mycolicibacterium elephantis]OBA68522.1 hypothetical protein A5633_25645 [Mycolicibacterium elephantis]
MLIVALVLAVIGLAALVTAVVTSNELIAWVCIAASAVGVLLLIVDAVRERSRGRADSVEDEAPAESEQFDAEYPQDDVADVPEDDAETTVVEQAEDEYSSGENNP